MFDHKMKKIMFLNIRISYYISYLILLLSVAREQRIFFKDPGLGNKIHDVKGNVDADKKH